MIARMERFPGTRRYAYAGIDLRRRPASGATSLPERRRYAAGIMFERSVMIRKTLIVSGCVAAIAVLLPLGTQRLSLAGQKYVQHDRKHPLPAVITPGECSTQDRAGAPPSDAIVLFNGHDLSNWESAKGGPAKWKVGDGYFEVAPGTGDIRTRQGFGDMQLHVEWATPTPPHGEDQDRGNSGVFLMGLFEVQVLDSYNSVTYADGQAGAIYGQYPPLVNACRAPGQWQTYDIIFHEPQFSDEGTVLRRARITVIQNGVLVQDDVAPMGPTGHHIRPQYPYMPDKLPLQLQDHNHPVRYRNLWVREISARPV
jgi:3-keto-disaccharide hydrolase